MCPTFFFFFLISSLFLNIDVSFLLIKYLEAFALPKKYSHGRLHEYKLKFCIRPAYLLK